LDQETRRISLAVKTPEPARKTNAPTDSSGARGIPPVSGNSFDGAALALLVAPGAEALADALAVWLADGLAVALAVAEALDIAVVEALEAGLAIMLSPIPMLFFIPMSSVPPEPIPPELIP
jgi:hypothetical protein